MVDPDDENDDNENNFDNQNYDDYNNQYQNQNFDENGNERAPSSSQTYLGKDEIKALRTMFVLLGINMMGTSSGQFLASGAIRVQDFSKIGK